MLVLSLSKNVLLLAILLLILYVIDNGNCDRNDNNNYLYNYRYPSQFRAPHSPSYEHIYIPGKKLLMRTKMNEKYLGDILLGGFFPIHQPPSNEMGSMQCTAIKRERGIQRLEAMLFALDVVNSRSSRLMSSILANNKMRFGALIYDSCDYESYAVERAFNMLLPSLNQCVSLTKKKESNLIAGVIGSASSTVSMAIADILRLAEVIQLSLSK
jgi:hypothetical protein